jgi:hypothetical protein
VINDLINIMFHYSSASSSSDTSNSWLDTITGYVSYASGVCSTSRRTPFLTASGPNLFLHDHFDQNYKSWSRGVTVIPQVPTGNETHNENESGADFTVVSANSHWYVFLINNHTCDQCSDQYHVSS